jgi:hypothetical protein
MVGKCTCKNVAYSFCVDGFSFARNVARVADLNLDTKIGNG